LASFGDWRVQVEARQLPRYADSFGAGIGSAQQAVLRKIHASRYVYRPTSTDALNALNRLVVREL